MENELEINNEIKVIIKGQMIKDIMNELLDNDFDIDKYLSFDEEKMTNLSFSYKRSYITEYLIKHAKIRLINK